MDLMAGFWLSDGPGNPDKYTGGVKSQARSLASWRHHHQHYHGHQESLSCILLFYFVCTTNNHRLLVWNLGCIILDLGKKFDQMLSLSHGQLSIEYAGVMILEIPWIGNHFTFIQLFVVRRKRFS